jgi:hypothetical protein
MAQRLPKQVGQPLQEAASLFAGRERSGILTPQATRAQCRVLQPRPGNQAARNGRALISPHRGQI